MIIGASLTASEAEGVADTAEWRRWIDRGRAPAADDGGGFRSSWADDLALLCELGIGEIAVTLEWSRLWPTPAGPDEAEVEFRRDVLQAIRDGGAQAWVHLVDGSLPGWFADDERGFTDDKARRLVWPRHVDWVGETFADLVDGWVPMREARQWAAWGQLVGATPPGNQRRRDTQKMVTALAEAEREAARLLRGSAPVATHITARVVSAVADDVKAAPHADWLRRHLIDDALFSLTEGAAQGSFDRVIAQLRPPIVVDAEGSWHAGTSPTSVDPLLDGLATAVDRLGSLPAVAAGDLADIPLEGAATEDHLDQVISGAMDVGAAGWWSTSAIDGWHWQRGFQVTPGLFDRDRTERPATAAIRRHTTA